MYYRWTLRQIPDERTVQNLAELLRIPRTLANVLVARGVTTYTEATKFFEPKLEDIHDPYLMTDMDKAVERVLRAVNKGELIWIHGDYDVDGTSSTAMVLQFLREIGGKVEYYIPDRFQEGYGLSKTSVKEARDSNASLIITVDVGITSYEPLLYAKQLGLDVIICDHHEPGETLPEAYAILDPLMPNNPYPFKHLAACGVAFKLIQAIAIKLNKESLAFKYLDYVAIASAADMVPLIGENRILASWGLDLINKNPRPGIKGLIYCTDVKLGNVNASNIVFSLAPLINAAGRLGDAKRSVEMMTQQNEVNAFRIAQDLVQDNRKRRTIDEETFNEAIPLAEDLLKSGNYKSLILYKPNWHPGVIGIVASRLVDRYHLPTVLMTKIDNLAKGSARSIHAFDIHNALKKCSNYLIEYGGHKHAAGLSLDEQNIDDFREDFNKIALNSITDDMLIPEILIDTELKLNELSPNFLNLLKKFSPFGYDNQKPVFITKNVASANGVKVVGNNHLKFRALQSNFAIDAIGYNLVEKKHICSNGKTFSIVYIIEEASFNGQNTIQLRIKDLKPDNTDA